MNTAALLPATWLEPRKPMIRAITVGNVTWAAAAALAFVARPELAPRIGAAERLALAAELAVAPAAVTLVMVLSCMRLFDTARAEDPFADAESREWKINQRVLSNTIEQGFIFVSALAALAVRIDAKHLAALLAAVALWCAGRLLFWVGYRHSVRWRAPGFDWTLNTTLAVLVWLATTYA
jgi:hypothetical protein